MCNINSNAIFYSTEINSIIQKFSGVINSNDFQKIINVTLELIEKHKSKYIIMNLLKSKKINTKDIDWLAYKIEDKLIRLNIEKIYIVIPQKGMVKLSAVGYQQKSNLNIILCFNMQEVTKSIKNDIADQKK